MSLTCLNIYSFFHRCTHAETGLTSWSIQSSVQRNLTECNEFFWYLMFHPRKHVKTLGTRWRWNCISRWLDFQFFFFSDYGNRHMEMQNKKIKPIWKILKIKLDEKIETWTMHSNIKREMKLKDARNRPIYVVLYSYLSFHPI